MTDSLSSAPEGDADLAAVISSGAARLGVDIEAVQIAELVVYLRLIDRWNGTYNLTAVRTLRAMATQHILDSLAVIPTFRSLFPREAVRRVLDVGSGAGLPGVVIAIVDRGASVVCVDSVGKKAAFVTQVASTLALGNLSAIHARVEAMRPPPSFGLIISRAFASLADFVSSTRHMLQPEGWWVAMKGKVPHQELAEADRLGVAFKVQPLHVPGLDAERCLLIGQLVTESKR